MDAEKTGRVISARRTQLGLTQKQLAELLHISDRTVSRWERGVGFPDVSLLEPLADALDLSLLELIRGERLPPARQPAPDAESSIRETARDLSRQFQDDLKRFKWLLLALALLLCAAGVILVWLIANPFRVYPISAQPITAAQAAAICPEILITTDEYALLSALLETDEICSGLSDDTVLTLDEAFSAAYRDRVQVNGQAPSYFCIEIVRHSLYVEYGTDCDLRILAVHTLTDEVEKCAFGYSGETETITGAGPDGQAFTILLPRDPDYMLRNLDNAEFFQAGEQRDLFANSAVAIIRHTAHDAPLRAPSFYILYSLQNPQ